MNDFATAFALAALLVRGAPVEAQPVSQTGDPAGAVISGTVHDSTGGAIASASVMVRVASGPASGTSGRRRATRQAGSLSRGLPGALGVTSR